MFQNIAKGAIKHLGIRKSKDRNAGLPIIGTYAARVLTPQRTNVPRQQTGQRAAKAAAREEDQKRDAKAAKKDKAKRDKSKPGTLEVADDEDGKPSASSDS